ncbi:MAG: hypothetical protein KGD58_14075 [Candidatus Lokiarchaeota archaeon]|nr:hypothetical protein [Candidatus Lokiarchaeota archaeon]
MEQLQEMDLNDLSVPECEKIEVCIECEAKAKEPVREKEVHRVPIKNRLSKLFKKSKYNAKYMEQVIPIQRLERERIHRNYGIY